MAVGWHDFLMNPEAIRSLYDRPPPLEGLEVRRFELTSEGSHLSMRMILPRFPNRPPRAMAPRFQ